MFPNAWGQHSHTVKIMIMLTDLPRAYICSELQELPVFSDCCSVSASLSLDGTAERFHGWVIFQVGFWGFLPVPLRIPAELHV